MKKLGVSTSGYAHDCTISDYMHRIKKAGYDSVDFDLFDYYDLIMHPDWMSWAEDVCTATLVAGLTVGQTHAQLGLFSNPDLSYEPPPEIFYRNLKICYLLGCKEIVFHPVFLAAVVETEDLYEKLVDYNVRWFKELIEPAKKLGVHISIENTADARPQILSAPFTRATDMMELIDRIGEPTFGICLDTGHAHIMSQDIPGMIRMFCKRLRTLHLNDNLGAITPVHPDQHLFPGAGTIDFPSIFDALKCINFTGVINLEPGEFLTRLPVDVRDAAMMGGALVARAYVDEAFDLCPPIIRF